MNFMPVRQADIPAQRAVGRLALGFAQAAGRTRVETFYQEGCLKARLPRPQDVDICEAVTVNISGGVAGGDVLTSGIQLGAGARVSIASQAAERIYRALNGTPARIATTISLSAGASLDYLPQETILFDGFVLERSLEIDLATGADYLGVESLVFGRQAMGEILRSGRLRDRITLRREGKLLLQDMTRLEGDIAARLRRKAIGNGAMAMALIICTDTDGMKAMRDALEGAYAGVSQMDGVFVARVLAPSANSLRKSVMAAIHACRAERNLPRVWQG